MMRGLLAVVFCQLVFCGPLSAAQPSKIAGAVAYTEIIRFDYTKDGTRDQVQFWLEFKASPAVGKPGDAAYKPESGAIYYYLVDVDRKKPVDNWLMGFSMMEGPPPSGPYPVNEIHIRGNTATFTAFGMTWTISDGGEGYLKDTVTIDDGFTSRNMTMYGGDLKIQDVDLAAHALDQDCMKCYECHQESVKKMITRGGKHNEVGCVECHVSHPPESTTPYTPCMACHEAHSDQMTEDSCARCHQSHTAAEVTYLYNVPHQYCVSCHQESADALVSSQSRHSSMSCALCHPEQHKNTVTCQHCHGGIHPEHVMKKTDICSACHHTAHELESGRTK